MSALFLFLNKTINVCEKVCSHTVVSFNLLALLITYKLIGEEESKFSEKGFLFLETVVQRCSVKKVLLEISQNSQKNTCARVSFSIKLQASDLQLY